MIEDIVRMLFIGSTNGAWVSLVALGYSLVYGVGGMMNIAHGSYVMLTGYILLWMLESPFFGGSEWLIVTLTLIILTLIGALTYILLVKPVQDSPINVVLITFAFAFLIELTVLWISGSEGKSISELKMAEGYIEIFGTKMQYQSLLVILISLIIVSVFALFINKSKLGKSIRAVSQDKEAATLMGINADRIYLYTFVIATFLAGVAACLSLPGANLEGPGVGFRFLTTSFAVVILGGMGSLVGSVVGAFILGYVNSFTLIFVPKGEVWSNIVPLIVIVIMLLFRPQGLFGKKEL
ncbi:MAG: branched-chain amino acid ABC transporter permease [Candidatus Thorarchaeota archaeon]